ncbi:MAG TPA: C1 family peptidase [Oligoflexus sp.]|uniref:C1 family peptidase n=1 Tax=Oligoflexus sp. TaxID=1971216 RepID=UPI002D5C44CE|nr:C1 family peptidase [Oligoflexus sp.]HYX37280.1 C1 family peptidase [Oligoflexus sp.]
MQKLGWIRDTKDERDRKYSAKASQDLPVLADFRSRYPRVWDQKSLGSCTAHAVGAAALYIDIYDRDMSIVVPSRLFIYYMTRALEGSIGQDVGATIRNSIKAVAKFGYPVEDSWPYVIKDFRERPSDEAISSAFRERVSYYERVDRDLSHFKEILSRGYPIVLGFSVYDSMYGTSVKKTGRIPVPKKGEKYHGGHAVLACGYDDEAGALIIRNSWGEDWGESGYGYLPYDFILNSNLSGDFWTIR